MNDSDTETVELPRVQFLNHMLPLAIEGDIKWECSEEVREDLAPTDFADPRKVTDVEVREHRVTAFLEFEKTVSERTSRATRWQPAEYKNHSVPVIVEVTLYFEDDPSEYSFPETEVLVHQADYPTKPPAPDI